MHFWEFNIIINIIINLLYIIGCIFNDIIKMPFP